MTNKSYINVLEREMNGITIKIRADLVSRDGLHWDLIMNSKNGAAIGHRIFLTVSGLSQVLEILDMFLTIQYLESVIEYREKADLYADIRNTLIHIEF
jgi:hypothetical protein